jgi:hypothetical protein
MKSTVAMLLALCLMGAAHAQTLSITELFGFPCTLPLYGTSTDRGTDAQGKVAFGTIFTITGLPMP